MTGAPTSFAAVVGDALDVATPSPVELATYLVGWLLGWALLARPHPLPTAPTPGPERAGIAVIVPARDEAGSIEAVVGPLVAQRRDGDRVLVVDDRSADATGALAARLGADVVVAPEPPPGWLGKPHACRHGADLTDQEVVAFVDADVRPGPTLLDDLAAAVRSHPATVVSVQPWHEMPTAGEQLSLLVNVTALMGCGAFTPLGRRAASTVAFGPVLALDRATYDAVGGHGADGVRDAHTEDIGLARAVGRSALFVGAPDATTFRMYPGGVRALLAGWTRSLATGAAATRWWVALATAAWVASLAGGWLAAPALYPLSALQVWALGRRAGTVRWWAALAFPALVVALVVVVARSAVALALGRDVTWKGRRVGTRRR